MLISENLESWQGKPVVDWTPEGAGPLTESTAYRLRTEYDAAQSWPDLFAQFLAQPNVEAVTALVVGMWEDPFDGNESLNAVVEAIVSAREKLPNLAGLFLGDITYEECEISWIRQGDLSALFTAYPRLEHFVVRGGQGLSLGSLRHDHLKSLIVQTGGLPTSVVAEVSQAELPALEQLELYLGAENYGGDSTVEDLMPLLQHGPERLPQLTYLGLRDCEYADALAAALAESGGVPLLRQVKTLDLSLGTLGDAGAQALVDCPAVARLDKLDIHYHFVTPEMVTKLIGLGIAVDASDAQDESKYGRFIAISE